jgi:hypothetical protein
VKNEKSDKRKFHRKEYPCKIIVDSLTKVLSARAIDISEGGLKVMLKEKLNSFLLVHLELILKDGKKVNCKGRVVRIKKRYDPDDRQTIWHDTGIEFEGLREADKKLIKLTIDSNYSRDRY